MTFAFLAGIALLVICALYLIRTFSSSSDFSLAADNVPEVIRQSSIHLKEGEIRNKELQLVCKPDVVFKHEGVKIIGENKTRKFFRVYESDIIQMSVGRVILEENGSAVSEMGFVRIVTPEGTRWLERKLLDRQQVVALHERYKQIQARLIEPGKCDNKNICKGCEFFTVC
ncbi:MAG: Dna2/Cas4 domain-containing protein [Methylophilus sp.]|uniref:Dna2/Cas4 domain-containing protein n=1 Tax=Methylophilus sp. TaxID=29541 RepID=UPI003FA1426C